jgi:hypothetical protein
VFSDGVDNGIEHCTHVMVHLYRHNLRHKILVFDRRCDLEHCVGLVFGDGLIFIQCTHEMRPYLGTNRLVKGVI